MCSSPDGVRLRQILAERGISDAMPTSVRKTLAPSSEAQSEAYATPGPPELKDARLKLVTSSLELAKKRLVERAIRAEHMEENWARHERGRSHEDSELMVLAFYELEQAFGTFSQASSTAADSRPLSSISYNFNGTQVATSSWSGDCKIWDISTCTCIKKLVGHNQRAQSIVFNPREQQPGYTSTPYSL